MRRPYNVTHHCGLMSSSSRVVPAQIQTAQDLMHAPFIICASVSTTALFTEVTLTGWPLVLTRYVPKMKVRKVKNLLSSKTEEEEEPEPIEEKDEVASYWHQVSCTTNIFPRCTTNLSFFVELDFGLDLRCPGHSILPSGCTNLPMLVPHCLLSRPFFTRVLTDIGLEHGMRDDTGTIGYYRPIIFPNDFWHLKG